MMRAWPTQRPDAPTSGRALFAVYLAAGLILYLPLEVALLSVLPPGLYWPLRLLPDALIAVLAASAIVDGALARSARVALLSLGAICGGVLIANVLRGFDWVDGVNALRVLVRYLVLGILLWGYGSALRGVGRLLLGALLVSGAIQIGAGLLGIGVDVLTAPSFTRFEALFLEDGTTGRYDRFGLFMAIVVLTAVAVSQVRQHWSLLVVGGLALLLLAFSTSRQAMVALAIGALVVAVMPRLHRRVRVMAAVAALVAITMPLYSPAFAVAPSLGEEGPAAPGIGRPIASRGSTSVSTDPNKNFRLFLSIDLAPWAAGQEPLLGFGPRQHVSEAPDLRLQQYVRAAGTTWDWARRFTNDSNYASMVIQFGPLLTGAMVALLGGLLAVVLPRAWVSGHPIPVLATACTVAIGAAAFLGPALEMRVTSLVLWIVLMTAVGMRRHSVTPT